MDGWFSAKHKNDVCFIYFTCLVLKVKVYMVFFVVARLFVDLIVCPEMTVYS